MRGLLALSVFAAGPALAQERTRAELWCGYEFDSVGLPGELVAVPRGDGATGAVFLGNGDERTPVIFHRDALPDGEPDNCALYHCAPGEDIMAGGCTEIGLAVDPLRAADGVMRVYGVTALPPIPPEAR